MKKLLIILSSVVFLFGFVVNVFAQSQPYTIKRFHSKLTVNQDTSLSVKEEIEVNFNEPRHGIYRVIPIVYSAKGETVKADFKLISVTDVSGNDIQFEKSRYNQSIKLKIGDPNRTITGDKTYIIEYQLDDVLRRFEDHEEIYWNVTGSEWDTTIQNVMATVTSPYAEITNSDCFAGRFGTTEKECVKSTKYEHLTFVSNELLGTGKDMSVVVGLSKDNQLVFPGTAEKISDAIADNWGYAVAPLPLLLMLYLWWKRGRDIRYLGDNIYYEPDEKHTITVSPFERKHLPLVYHPIDNLSPAEVGTIIDEKVDIQDVVAEITELARLGYLKITKEKGKKKYTFNRTKKKEKDLKDYQSYLLEKLFSTGDEVKLSDLKNKFYKYLNEFRKKLYEGVNEKYFAGNPNKVRILWIFLYVMFFSVLLTPVIIFAATTSNPFPVILSVILFIPGIFFAINMPRRTAQGYALYRQIEGLKWYLKKGEWRHEINEKNLFFEEMLPLAISLGVVNQLARDMKDIGIEAPSYMNGITAATLSSDIRCFNSVAASNLSSSPSGNSSWSGSSGFSGGGSAGGGFGGGGGGSW